MPNRRTTIRLFMQPLAVLWFVLFTVSAYAFPPAPILQTGQIACYDASGAVVDCAGSGQDGESQNGLAWPNLRFVDNSDQTMIDKLTGLVWTKDANLMKSRDPSFDSDVVNSTPQDGVVSWQHALDYIKKLNTENYLGYHDWRLPNINELASLANLRQNTNATMLNGLGFTNVQPYLYWSSTTAAVGTSYAWGMYMGLGVVEEDGKAMNHYVWPVRSEQLGAFGSLARSRTGQSACYDSGGTIVACDGTGQDGETQNGMAWPTPRFKDNGYQSMTDALTGLVWSKDANPAGKLKTWQDALDYIKSLNNSNYLGHNDWHLPNLNELESLINKEKPNNASWLNAQGFYNVQEDFYWSGTTYAHDTANAWNMLMNDGSVNGYKGTKASYSHYVWPVRSGQYWPFDDFLISVSPKFGAVPVGAPANSHQIEVGYRGGSLQACLEQGC